MIRARYRFEILHDIAVRVQAARGSEYDRAIQQALEYLQTNPKMMTEVAEKL